MDYFKIKEDCISKYPQLKNGAFVSYSHYLQPFNKGVEFYYYWRLNKAEQLEVTKISLYDLVLVETFNI